MLAFGIVTGADRMCLPVLFKEMSLDLGLSMVSVGTIWGMDPLAGVFVCLPGGLLADRFGLKRTLTVTCILAGIFCALRGLSGNFLTLAVTSFLFGLMATIVFTVAPKATAVWFNGRLLGLSNALIQVAMSLGSIAATMLSATVLSPLLGGWRNVLIMFGIPSVITGLLWWFTGREPDKSETFAAKAAGVPLGEAISKVIRLKEVWILGLMQFCFMGSMTGFGGYLAIYLRNIGWSDLSADTAVTLSGATGLVGMIPMVMLANRLHSLRGMLVFSMAMITVNLAVLPFIEGYAVYVLLVVGGLLRSGAPALINTLIFQVKEVGGKYGGTAVGLTTTIGMLGSFSAPPIGNSLAGISPGMPIIFWGILAAVSVPLFLFIKKAPAPEGSLQTS